MSFYTAANKEYLTKRINYFQTCRCSNTLAKSSDISKCYARKLKEFFLKQGVEGKF